jgi:hypothetical protein
VPSDFEGQDVHEQASGAGRGEIATACLKRYWHNIIVMPGLDPGIHQSRKDIFGKGWIAGSSPAMTEVSRNRLFEIETPSHRPGLEPGPITTNVRRRAKQGPQLYQ